MSTEPDAVKSGCSARVKIEAPPIVVAIVAATEWVQATVSAYKRVLSWVERRQPSLHGPKWLRQTRPVGSDGAVLVAGSPDAAVVYVGGWLVLLLVLVLLSPRLSAGDAADVVGGACALAFATVRYLDLTTYQLGILLDPRQRKLRGPERSLVLLALNLTEVTMIGGIWFFAGGYRVSGHRVGRSDAWLHAVNLVGTLSSVTTGSVMVVCAQLAILAVGLLLLIVSIGVLIGLIGMSFSQQT
jgi:hypothetical protein